LAESPSFIEILNEHKRKPCLFGWEKGMIDM